MVNRVVCLCAMLMLAGFSTVLGVDDSDEVKKLLQIRLNPSSLHVFHLL